MNISKQKGNIVELSCITEFTKMGFVCSIPYGDSARYDFIVDVNGKLLKVQCKAAKYCSQNKNSFFVYLYSMNYKNGKYVKKYYTNDEIDIFATYIHENMYLIPVINQNIITLNFNKTKSKNQFEANFADDYLAKNFLKNINNLENNV